MPSFDISKRDLESLVRRKFTIKELEDEAILYAKAELDGVQGDRLKVDVKDTNRPDLWSVEGIARELRGNYRIEEGLPHYKATKSGLRMQVTKVPFHPYATAAIVRGVKITEEVHSQMIQLQEKISGTLGRNRRALSIGAYDMKKVRFPVRYTSMKPKDIRFAPLGFSRQFTAKEILEQHEKGKQYGDLIRGLKEYSVWLDADDKILALEPITNSNDAGNVTTSTRDIFLEATGDNLTHLHTAINVVTTALADRGGRIESLEVHTPRGREMMPNLAPKKASLDPDYARRILGLSLSNTELVKMLRQARYNARASANRIQVEYPCYRQDIMHQRDVLEDVAISFGYNDIEPQPPSIPTIGSRNPVEDYTDTVSSVCIGLSLQEVMNFFLTNKENLFTRMALPHQRVAEIENPVSSNWTVFRSSILPSLLNFLSLNKNQEYPQKIFEAGDVVLLDTKTDTGTRNQRRLAVALTDIAVGYHDITSFLDALLSNLGISYSLKKHNHPSFLPDRVASVVVNSKSIGVVGEIHPKILNNWSIEKPVAALEVDL